MMAQVHESIPAEVAPAVVSLLAQIAIVREIPTPNEPIENFALKSRAYYDNWGARLSDTPAESLIASIFELIGEISTPGLGGEPGHEHLNIHYKLSHLRDLARAVLTAAHSANLSSSVPVIVNAEALAPQIAEIKSVLGNLKEKVDKLASAEASFSDGISLAVGPVSITLSAFNEAIASARRAIEMGVEYNAFALSSSLTRIGALAGELLDETASFAQRISEGLVQALREVAELALWLARQGVELFDQAVKAPPHLSATSGFRRRQTSYQPVRGGHVAVVLGTSDTVIAVTGRGIVLREPSVALEYTERGRVRIAAVGHAASDLIGRTPRNMKVIRPVQEGIVVNHDMAAKMLKHQLARVRKSGFFSPNMLMCVPSASTSVERRAFQEIAFDVGARKAYLAEKPMAAAIGAGLDVAKPAGNLVVQLGAGMTEAALLALGGIVFSRGVRCGGDHLNVAIATELKNQFELEVGWPTLERIKLELASAVPRPDHAKEILVKGSVDGVPREVAVNSGLVSRAIASRLEEILEPIKIILETVPPELAHDIIEAGLVLTGGGALLPNIADLIREETGLPCRVAAEPKDCAAKGLERMLSNLKASERYILSAFR